MLDGFGALSCTTDLDTSERGDVGVRQVAGFNNLYTDAEIVQGWVYHRAFSSRHSLFFA